MTSGFRFDLFCRVVDNFGDAGVCWRLARQLAAEYPIQVRLWIDRLETLQKISPALNAGKAEQLVSGVTVRHWPEVFPDTDTASIPDVVIEGFGCHLPDNYLLSMAHCHRQPVWINMEYLSAESWVDNCHRMASPQSSLPLTRHFFFPGFTGATGGLFREAGLIEKRTCFQADDAGKQAFLQQLGVDNAADDVLSLFCYEDAPVMDLFRMLAEQKEKSVLCLVPEGVASASVSRFLGCPAKAGEKQSEGALTVQVIPIVSQDAYDRLLWSCDLNFVRGEDSFLRAQWAARPFV
ncbi:MAG: elongation factor P maturation arginine rhamnosyltransferase EarP, partial [Oxalobacter sp.]|nr:elongation factor P maturation arginine rhamnosyltransferase EarP [Oxalobacter sp.]